MTLEEMYYKISVAIEPNIMVFDSDAAPGKVTHRLLALLSSVYSRNYIGYKLDKIYIPEDENVLDLMSTIKNEDGSIELTDITKVYGATLIKTPLLNYDREGVKFFKDTCKGCLASYDIGIIIGCDKDERRIILGSY